MLLIIEVLFLVVGVWAIISGKIPTAFFKLLFGKGEYALSPNNTRLFGLLLASPRPASFLVSILLTALLGTNGMGYAAMFEFVLIFTVIILSIFIARKARLSERKEIDHSHSVTSPSEPKIGSYGLRLLMIFGIIVLVFVTIAGIVSLVMVIISSVTVGTRLTGNFWEDVFPFILMIAVTGLALFGIVKLSQALRKKI